MKFKKALLINIEEKKLDKEYWKQIDSLVEKKVFLTENSPKIMQEIKDTDLLLVGFATPVTKAHLDAAPKLKYIETLAVAYHKIDVNYAKKKGIPVSNIAGYCTDSVAEMIIAMILSEIRHLHEERERASKRNYDFIESSTELKGKVFAVFGTGNIGTRTAELAQAFKADVRYWNRTRKKELETKGMKYEEKNNLLKNADFISINFAYTSETENFFDKKAFSIIKPGAIIINTVPMEVVDLKALEERLKKNDITFILDHSDEMKKEDIEKLHKYKNCIIYPPLGVSKEARINKQKTFVANIKNFLEGKPTNVVN